MNKNKKVYEWKYCYQVINNNYAFALSYLLLFLYILICNSGYSQIVTDLKVQQQLIETTYG